MNCLTRPLATAATALTLATACAPQPPKHHDLSARMNAVSEANVSVSGKNLEMRDLKGNNSIDCVFVYEYREPNAYMALGDSTCLANAGTGIKAPLDSALLDRIRRAYALTDSIAFTLDSIQYNPPKKK